MFSQVQLEDTIELHEKSYRLLTWVNGALKRNVMKFDVLHEAMSAAEAAKEWIGRHYETIPLHARPSKSKIPAFANLFASYLATSFELEKSPGTPLESYCGCYCPMCSYLSKADYLKVRKLSKNARKAAYELKSVYLTVLSEELELPMIRPEIDQLLNDKEIYPAIALAAYGYELIRRTEFASQGEGILALWREIAWDGNAPRKKFAMKAADVLDAERKIIEKMKTFQ